MPTLISSLHAKDCYDIAVELQNTFYRGSGSHEGMSSQAISMVLSETSHLLASVVTMPFRIFS